MDARLYTRVLEQCNEMMCTLLITKIFPLLAQGEACM